MSKIYDWSDLAQDYARLQSSIKVAQLYGCSKKTVLDALHQQGIAIIPVTGRSRFDKDAIVEDFLRVQSSKRVAEKHGTSVGNVNIFFSVLE